MGEEGWICVECEWGQDMQGRRRGGVSDGREHMWEEGSPKDGANAGALTHEVLLRCLVTSVGKPLVSYDAVLLPFLSHHPAQWHSSCPSALPLCHSLMASHSSF